MKIKQQRKAYNPTRPKKKEGVTFKFTHDGSNIVITNNSGSSTADSNSVTSINVDDDRLHNRRRSKRKRESVDYTADEYPRVTNTIRIRKDYLYNHPSLSSGESFTFCQSCNCPCRRINRIKVNIHHHINPFYSPYAIYSTLSGGSPYLQNNTWNSQTAYETVSAKPTTAAIPVEKISLCEVCAGLFLTHRLHCDTCNYIPRLDERMLKDCTRCFDGVICRM